MVGACDARADPSAKRLLGEVGANLFDADALRDTEADAADLPNRDGRTLSTPRSGLPAPPPGPTPSANPPSKESYWTSGMGPLKRRARFLYAPPARRRPWLLAPGATESPPRGAWL